MCIVIDANMACDFANGAEHTKPISKYIEQGGLVTLNEKLLEEYPKRVHPLFAELARSNRVRKFTLSQLPDELQALVTSDDPHIIDLVLQSKTTVVCTQDKALTDDLTNHRIIKNPRCKVYQHDGAKDILRGCCT